MIYDVMPAGREVSLEVVAELESSMVGCEVDAHGASLWIGRPALRILRMLISLWRYVGIGRRIVAGSPLRRRAP